MSDYTIQIQGCVDEIRQEVNPPPDAEGALTRDQISAQDWADYEWADVTTHGDGQRHYIRGLKR